MKKVSEEFWNAIIHSSSCGGDLVCDLCGRVHFASWDPGAYERDDLKVLEKKAEKNPDKYINHTDSSVGWGEFNGLQIIYGCCDDKVKKFEDLIWGHRRLITHYLKARTAQAVETAKMEQDEVKDLEIQQ